MASIHLVVWNMEWMNDLFSEGSGAAAFRPDNAKPAHSTNSTVLQRRKDLAAVLDELAPDVVVVVEGPNRTEELQLFFDTDVQGQWVTHIQRSPKQSQALGVCVRTDTGKFASSPLQAHDTIQMSAFDGFPLDIDDDGIDELYRFERKPVYATVRLAAGQEFRILGVHLKSKGIFSAYEWSKWWQVADANRKKLLAQATQLRTEFLDPLLRNPATRAVPLIVCGDINDGPGLDDSEKRLFGSAVERLMGLVWFPELCLGNALFESLTDAERHALKFEELATTSFKDPIFNDTRHNEWIDHILYTRNQGRTWVRNGLIHETLGGGPIWRRFPHASDHYPVSVEVEL